MDKRRLGKLFLFVGVAVLIAVAPHAFGQTLPNGAPDPSGDFGSAGPSDLLNGYYTASSGWITALQTIANQLFWALATIDFTWTCITLVLQHSELQGWMAGFIRKVLTIAFFGVLLQNGAAWTADIVNFFINVGQTAGGRSVTGLSASGIMGNGVELAGQMLGGAASAAAASASTNPISLLIGGVGSLAPTIILALGSLLIVLCYVIIALHFVMAMVEAYVVVGAGYIFLGFGGSRWTVPYTEKYMGMVVSAGVRIMVLELIIGLGSTLQPLWTATAVRIASVPDIFSGGSASGTWSGVQAEFGLVASIAIFALLCWTIPQIAANVASGGLSMSGGDVISSGAAAGTAAFAGASYAAGSSSNAGAGSDVQQVAQAAAMKGAEIGVTAAAAAATGGAGAAVGAAEMAGGGGGISTAAAEMSGKGIVVEAPASLDLDPANGAGGVGEPSAPSSLDADSDSDGAGSQGASGKTEGGTNGGGSGEGDAAEADGNQAVAAGNARAEQGQNADATRANAAAGIDQAQQEFQDAVRKAGSDARVAALDSGASPQEAIRAEHEARASAAKQGIGLIRRTSSLVNDLEGALNRLPDDGGRMNGTTPNIGHDSGE